MTAPVMTRRGGARAADEPLHGSVPVASTTVAVARRERPWWLRRAPETAVLVGGLGVAFFAPFDAPWWLLALRASAGVVLATGTVATWGRQRTRRELERTCARLFEQQRSLRAQLADQTRLFRDTVKGVLALLFIERLALTRNERISLYSHQSGSFVLLERFSLHPEYTRRPQRFIYKETQGCLGAAWRDGSCIVCFTPDPHREPERYARELVSTWNMPEVKPGDVGMPVREMATFALLDPAGRRTVGVVVFESCRGDGLPLERIRRYLESYEGQQLAEFACSDRAPDIGMSMKEAL